MHCIIGGSSTWGRFVSDQARITKAADIDIELLEVVFAPALAGLFADTIYSAGFHNGILWSVFPGGCRAENRYRTWPIDLFNETLFGHVEYMKKAIHIQFPGKSRIFF